MTRRLAVAAALLGVLTDCGPGVPSVSGAWTAPYGGHLAYIELLLQQDGSILSGKACRSDSGVLIFSQTPVLGHYPDLAFTVHAADVRPCCTAWAGTTFRGSFNQDGATLTGSLVRPGTGAPDVVVFQRSSTGLCEDARPL
jgi:hypothetical protein